jgi:hypothetical protein
VVRRQERAFAVLALTSVGAVRSARYVNNIDDVRISVTQTIMRSYDLGRLSIHRKLPRTESLKDCMERTIPYWTSTIEPEVPFYSSRPKRSHRLALSSRRLCAIASLALL